MVGGFREPPVQPYQSKSLPMGEAVEFSQRGTGSGDLDARNVTCVVGIGDRAHSVTTVTVDCMSLSVFTTRPIIEALGRLNRG